MGNTHATWRPGKQSRSVRSTLLLLLLVLTLTSTVSFAQGGQQGPSAEVDAVVDQPPHPPEPEPPEITLPPAEPGEDVYIGEVAIGSAEQLATLQQLGYGCGQSALCEIEATEAQVSALQQAGFAVDIVGLAAESRAFGEAESSDQAGALEAYRYGSRFTDIPIPTLSSATSPINISGAPSGARVTRVKYEVRVVVTGLMGGVNQYTLEIRPASASAGHTIWNREGGATDRGRDDDAADDRWTASQPALGPEGNMPQSDGSRRDRLLEAVGLLLHRWPRRANLDYACHSGTRLRHHPEV
jgi:hypothetical protein